MDAFLGQCGKETAMHRQFKAILFVFAVAVCGSGAAYGGQVLDAADMESMTIEELRAYQGYFYSTGGRDPMVMRLPTDSELGVGEKSRIRAPTLEEQESELTRWLSQITDSITQQDYDQALTIAAEAINTIDNEWPPIKPEHTHLLRMNEEIRNYNSMASRLKSQQDIGKEFTNLGLKVDGVSWSPMDARAIVNGMALSAGEVMLNVRKQGDLRVEIIEEHGVVFQFQGMRFRLPVSVYSQ